MLKAIPRTRNLLLPIGLAALAAVLVGIYVVSYRHKVTHGASLVGVLVASRDVPAGTAGSEVASGGYLKEQTVPRRAVVPGPHARRNHRHAALSPQVAPCRWRVLHVP